MRHFQRLLLWEIGIEFKTGLYFLCLMFYYGVYRWSMGYHTAELLLMIEMLAVLYIMGYVKAILLGDFDEAERYGVREWAGAVLCCTVYTGAAWLFAWFDRSTAVTAGFFLYMAVCQVCMFLLYKVKRIIETKHLNQELESFKARRKERL